MLEELRKNVLSLLEARVEFAIGVIQALRSDKLALESQIAQMRNDLKDQKDRIQELEIRNEGLQCYESELRQMQEEREQEREAVGREKAEIRERVEALMTMLDGINNYQQASEFSALDVSGEESNSPDFSENDASE